jgi:cytidine deaminase
MHESELVVAAKSAMLKAYAPYSGFAVGAALRTASGIFVGSNIENISLGLTICAERAAIAAAISAGERTLLDLTIVSDSAEPATPCGACRQVLAEFNPALRIISWTTTGAKEEFELTVLLPKPRQGILESHVQTGD